jgi:hypothetical protein
MLEDELRGEPPAAPEEGPPAVPTPLDLQRIREAILAGDHQAAIDAAISAYGLTARAFWDPELPKEGDADGHTKIITIGPPAFVHPETGLPRSLGWLVSSIAHESIHMFQLRAIHPVDGGDNYARLNTTGDSANEAQAYDWEIRNAEVLGLSAEERAELIDRRQEHGLAIAQDPFYARRIAPLPGGVGNDYWIKPEDR